MRLHVMKNLGIVLFADASGQLEEIALPDTL